MIPGLGKRQSLDLSPGRHHLLRYHIPRLPRLYQPRVISRHGDMLPQNVMMLVIATPYYAQRRVSLRHRFEAVGVRARRFKGRQRIVW